MAKITAVVHTGGVRLETREIIIELPRICETSDMKQIKDNILRFFIKKHSKFSLHSHKTDDINPIIKINVSVAYLRHCSTTFYQ